MQMTAFWAIVLMMDAASLKRRSVYASPYSAAAQKVVTFGQEIL
jgi:hypothetical protein